MSRRDDCVIVVATCYGKDETETPDDAIAHASAVNTRLLTNIEADVVDSVVTAYSCSKRMVSFRLSNGRCLQVGISPSGGLAVTVAQQFNEQDDDWPPFVHLDWTVGIQRWERRKLLLQRRERSLTNLFTDGHTLYLYVTTLDALAFSVLRDLGDDSLFLYWSEVD